MVRVRAGSSSSAPYGRSLELTHLGPRIRTPQLSPVALAAPSPSASVSPTTPDPSHVGGSMRHPVPELRPCCPCGGIPSLLGPNGVPPCVQTTSWLSVRPRLDTEVGSSGLREPCRSARGRQTALQDADFSSPGTHPRLGFHPGGSISCLRNGHVSCRRAPPPTAPGSLSPRPRLPRLLSSARD